MRQGSHPKEVSQIPLGRDVLCSADRGASPQRYNRKYLACRGNNQAFIPAAEMQQVSSRTGRHKNIKRGSGVEFQQSPWVRSTQPAPAAALPWDTLRAAQGASPPSHPFLPRWAQIPRGSAAIWGSPSLPQPPQHHCWRLALKPSLPSGWLCCQSCSHLWKANALHLL